MKEKVYMFRAVSLVRKFGCTVISPGHRLAVRTPYPAVIHDCCETLVFMKDHALAPGIDPNRLTVGGKLVEQRILIFMRSL